MRNALRTIQRWRAEGKQIALATVVKTEGSTPRRAGARLIVSSTGDMEGSVSGGCVENDVIHHAQEILKTGDPRLIQYAITDEMVWDVGLACGGTIEVWVERLDEINDSVPGNGERQPQAELERAVTAGQLIAQAVLLNGPGRPGSKLLVWPSGETLASLGDKDLDRQVAADAVTILPHLRAKSLVYDEPTARVFIEVFPAPPQLVIFGAVHIAIPLTTLAKLLGFQVIIVDPRTKFANSDRFPHADRIIPEWPQKAVEQIDIGPSTVCVVLTHDPKIDEPALKSLVGKGAAYVGAIGSRKTHTERFERMVRRGIDAEKLAEVYAPIGLDLGAETPEEIALAIVAEIVAVRRGAPAGFLRTRSSLT